MYTAEELCSLNSHDVRPSRFVRMTIFSPRLWQPVRQRRPSQRLFEPRRHRGSGVSNDRFMKVGCVNACSANKAATLSRTIVDERLDSLVITETWHEVGVDNFEAIHSARLSVCRSCSADTTWCSHRHCRLPESRIIHRDIIRFQRRSLDHSPSTFEYLYG